MTVKIFPEDLYPSSMELDLEFNNVVFTSPYTSKEQFEKRPGERWVAKFSYKDLEQDEARELHGFLLGMEGVIGQFSVPDFAFYTRRGSISGQPKVDGNTNQGNLCKIKDCPPNREIFKRGDYVKINTRIHMISEDVRSDAGGKAQIRFVPRMLAVPTDGMFVVYDNFSFILRLKDNKQTNRRSEDMVNSFSFEAVEVI